MQKNYSIKTGLYIGLIALIGVVLAITPFNDPLNLVAHKLGPAIAGGNSVILKPASATPLSACELARCIEAAGLPAAGTVAPARSRWPPPRNCSAKASRRSSGGSRLQAESHQRGD